MNASRFLAAAAAAWALACSQPRAPEPAGDTSELTCDEKARAQSVCQAALRQRCESDSNQCDQGCGPPAGNSTALENPKGAPQELSDFKTAQCRDNCRHGLDGCLASVPKRCPELCP